MAIYPDKKDGKLTGRFRVELQRGRARYRKRWDSFKEAEEDEKAVLASWDRGEDLPAPGAAPGAPEVHTFATVIPLAKQQLWLTIKNPETAWMHVETAAQVIGWNTKLDDVDTLAMDKVVAHVSKLGKANSTINHYLSHLLTFLKWAKSRKYRTIAIKDEIEIAWRDEVEGRIRWITADEEEAIKTYLLSRDSKHAATAAAIWKLIKVAIETGCRRDELLTADLSQVNGNRLHLWKTKTDTPRTVPMSDETRELLLDLLRSKTMPTRRGLRSWWLRVKKELKLEHDSQFVFHVTRHTCATRLVDAGVNVFVIKEWMGHKRIETTLRYAHVKPQNLEDALVKVGDYKLRLVQNPQFSAGSSLPPSFPTVGGMLAAA